MSSYFSGSARLGSARLDSTGNWTRVISAATCRSLGRLCVLAPLSQRGTSHGRHGAVLAVLVEAGGGVAALSENIRQAEVRIGLEDFRRPGPSGPAPPNGPGTASAAAGLDQSFQISPSHQGSLENQSVVSP